MNQLPATTHMGPVELTVADLERSLDYYRTAIGLGVLSENGGEASLGAGETELLRLVEEPGAAPSRGYSGLFHLALLLPDRGALGQWLAHAARDRVQLTGASDHTVSEALYLRDPDSHGIEIYADRPREQWEGRVGAGCGAASEEERSSCGRRAAGSTRGQGHVWGGDVDDNVRFYRDEVGI